MIKLINKYKVVALIILLIIVNFLFIFGKNLFSSQSALSENLLATESVETMVMDKPIPQSDSVVTESPLNEVKRLPVFICGAIEKPGVYYVEAPAIVNDVVTIAGGFLGDANRNAVNLAKAVKGNEKIYVPKMGEALTEELAPENSEGNAAVLININTADQKTLETLPGIGPAKAIQIISYRESKGTFKSIDGLKEVSGIGTKIYDGLKDLITIE